MSEYKLDDVIAKLQDERDEWKMRAEMRTSAYAEMHAKERERKNASERSHLQREEIVRLESRISELKQKIERLTHTNKNLLEAIDGIDSTLCQCRNTSNRASGCNCDVCAVHKMARYAISESKSIL
jgi:predicted RNase H-like nuclease (RuvC/YqgF family)